MFGGFPGRIRRIERALERMNPRRRIRLKPAASHAVGPKLVRGRGHRRRATLVTFIWFAFYLALAATLTIVLFKHFVAPAIG